MAEAWPTLLFRYNAPGVWQLLGRDVNAPALIALVVGCLAGGFASVILSRMFIECGLHQIFPCFFDGTSAGGDPAAQRYSRLRPTRARPRGPSCLVRARMGHRRTRPCSY